MSAHAQLPGEGPPILTQAECTRRAQRTHDLAAQHEILRACFEAETIRSSRVEWGSFADEISGLNGREGYRPNTYRCQYVETLKGTPRVSQGEGARHCYELLGAQRCPESEPRCAFAPVVGVMQLLGEARRAVEAGRTEEASALHYRIVVALNQAEQRWEQFEAASRVTTRTTLVAGGLAGAGVAICGGGVILGSGALAGLGTSVGGHAVGLGIFFSELGEHLSPDLHGVREGSPGAAAEAERARLLAEIQPTEAQPAGGSETGTGESASRRRWVRDEGAARFRAAEEERARRFASFFAPGRDVTPALAAVVAQSGTGAPGTESGATTDALLTGEMNEALPDQLPAGAQEITPEMENRSLIQRLGLLGGAPRLEPGRERRTLSELERVAVHGLQQPRDANHRAFQEVEYLPFALDRDLATRAQQTTDRERQGHIGQWGIARAQSRARFSRDSHAGLARVLREQFFPALNSHAEGVVPAFLGDSADLSGATEFLANAYLGRGAPRLPAGQQVVIEPIGGGKMRLLIFTQATAQLLDPLTGETSARDTRAVYRPEYLFYRFIEQRRAAGATVESPVALNELMIPFPARPTIVSRVPAPAGRPGASQSATIAPAPRVARNSGMPLWAGAGLGEQLDSALGGVSAYTGRGAVIDPSASPSPPSSEFVPGANMQLREQDVRAVATVARAVAQLAPALLELIRRGLVTPELVASALSWLSENGLPDHLGEMLVQAPELLDLLKSLGPDEIQALREAGLFSALESMGPLPSAGRAGIAELLRLTHGMPPDQRLQFIRAMGSSGLMRDVARAAARGEDYLGLVVDSPYYALLPPEVRRRLELLRTPEYAADSRQEDFLPPPGEEPLPPAENINTIQICMEEHSRPFEQIVKPPGFSCREGIDRNAPELETFARRWLRPVCEGRFSDSARLDAYLRRMMGQWMELWGPILKGRLPGVEVGSSDRWSGGVRVSGVKDVQSCVQYSTILSTVSDYGFRWVHVGSLSPDERRYLRRQVGPECDVATVLDGTVSAAAAAQEAVLSPACSSARERIRISRLGSSRQEQRIERDFAIFLDRELGRTAWYDRIAADPEAFVGWLNHLEPERRGTLLGPQYLDLSFGESPSPEQRAERTSYYAAVDAWSRLLFSGDRTVVAPEPALYRPASPQVLAQESLDARTQVRRVAPSPQLPVPQAPVRRSTPASGGHENWVWIETTAIAPVIPPAERRGREAVTAQAAQELRRAEAPQAPLYRRGVNSPSDRLQERVRIDPNMVPDLFAMVLDGNEAIDEEVLLSLLRPQWLENELVPWNTSRWESSPASYPSRLRNRIQDRVRSHIQRIGGRSGAIEHFLRQLTRNNPGNIRLGSCRESLSTSPRMARILAGISIEMPAAFGCADPQ